MKFLNIFDQFTYFYSRIIHLIYCRQVYGATSKVFLAENANRGTDIYETPSPLREETRRREIVRRKCVAHVAQCFQAPYTAQTLCFRFDTRHLLRRDLSQKIVAHLFLNGIPWNSSPKNTEFYACHTKTLFIDGSPPERPPNILSEERRKEKYTDVYIRRETRDINKNL